MRQFASSGFRLWNLSREAKLVYTAFGVFSLLGLASSAALYEDMVGGGGGGIGPEAVRTYYAGDRAPALAPSPGLHPSGLDPPGLRPPGTRPPASALAGPELALPDEESGAPRPLSVPMPYRKLLEVTHFHLFTVPVFLLIVAHLFMLTGLGSRAKLAWIAAGWSAALLHIAAPWAVRFGGAPFALLHVGSGVALAVTATTLTVYPVYAMWWGGPPPPPPPPPPTAPPPPPGPPTA